MNRLTLTAIALLVPAALFAEVNVRVNATINTPDIVVADEPWFEESECTGNSQVSIEYQWIVDRGVRVLNFRQVTFVPATGAWIFAPWMIHHGKMIHHPHNDHFVREFSHYDGHRNPQYRYVYRENRRFHQSPVVISRYEYAPQQYNQYPHNNHQEYNRYQNNVPQEHNRYQNNTYQEHNRYQNNVPQEHNRYQNTTPRKEVIVEKRVVKEERTPLEYYSNDRRNDPSNNPTIVRVTERERIR